METDGALAQAVHQGDYHAFRKIYERHWKRLYRYTGQVIGSDIDAEDIVQDLFIHFWEKSQAEPIASIDAYFHTALRFRILTYFEKSKVRQHHLGSLAKYMEQQAHDDDEAFTLKDLNQQVAVEIDRLPAKMREIFILRKYKELSYREISELLNISETTVKKQLYNATKLLKSKLSGLMKSITILFF